MNQLTLLISQTNGGNPGLLVIIYWILLLLVAIGSFIPTTQWQYAPRFSTVVMLILFIIIGIKILKPNL
jgi:uncharacterized membrane protein